MQVFPGRVSYFLVLVIALIDAVWIGLSRLTLPLNQLVSPALNVAMLLIAILVVKRTTYSDERTKKIFFLIGTLFQGLIFLQVSWIAIRLFGHVSMTSDFPYTDALLMKWDRWLGLDWTAYFEFVEKNDLIRNVLGNSYTSLTPVSFAAFLLLMVQAEVKRTRFFLETFLFCAAVCTSIGMFFPAKAAVAMYFGDTGTMAHLATLPGVYHIEPLERLRSGIPFALDLSDMPGLVTFPSFHTAAGIILVVSFWGTRLFPVALAYGAVMIASTPVFGGHYFVDLIAGAVVALAVVAVLAAQPFYKGMFRWAQLAPSQAKSSPSRLEAPS